MRSSGSILLAFFAVIFLSCSPKVTPVLEFEGGRLEINEMDFDYFQGKTRIVFKDEDYDINAKATIRIRKDSVIWMNFSSAGITGVRCLIDYDSITILNALKKEYYVFTYPELTDRFNFTIDYESIQAAALGNLIINRKQSDMAAERDTFLVLKQKEGMINVENYIHRDTHKITRVDLNETSSNNTASINYQDFQMVNDQYFPFSGLITLFYKAENTTLNTTLEFEYSKAEIVDRNLKFPFKIPKKYVGR